MDDLLRERLDELSERLNELVARVSRLEQGDAETRRALIVVLTRLKTLEARHRPPVLKRRRS